MVSSVVSKKKLWVKAVDEVSFTLGFNETLGLVGESGSGKTTLGRAVLMLDVPTRGDISFKGENIAKLKGEDLRLKRREMQIVFQDPMSSLDPRQRLKDIVLEPLRAFQKYNKDLDQRKLVSETLALVGLPDDSLMRFPHQFSGGQRQRIAIARALILNPQFLVLDEPTSALDSSIQTQILNLLRRIQDEKKLSYLFISHNVNVVKYMADRIAVMYCGKIIEIGRTRDVIEKPLHPYTIALISAVPQPDPEKNINEKPLKGEIPSPVNVPTGCRFHPRCPYAVEICKTTQPELIKADTEHWSACHFAADFKEGKHPSVLENHSNN
jgi:peptide/nickel transport system ATP-binding protein/oligopeptide transport system ATP-binding protein